MALSQKMNKRSMVLTIREETKKKAKERPKDIQLARSTKKERDSLSCGSYLTHSPCMQIVISNNNERFRISYHLPTQSFFLQ
jgi:hypothetical protein